MTVTACVTSLAGNRHVQHILEADVRAGAVNLGKKLMNILKETEAKAVLDEISEDTGNSWRDKDTRRGAKN